MVQHHQAQFDSQWMRTMSELVIRGLLKHQQEFIEDTSTRYVGLIGGYGCGKTRAFCLKAIQMAALNVGHTGMLCEPTNTMLYDVLIPEFQMLLDLYGIPFTYKQSPRPTFVLHFANGTSEIKMRSAENFGRLVGLNLGWFGVDEIDTAFNRKKDSIMRMWRVLISRLRSKAPFTQAFVCSTPEGFGFLYEFFIKEVDEAMLVGKNLNRKMIKAKTRDNPHLDPEYLADLTAQYPPNLLRAYMEGEFVNLNTATIYDSYDRDANNDVTTLESFETDVGMGIYMPAVLPANISMDQMHALHSQAKNNALAKRTPLHIGMDFNVGKCAAVVHLIDAIGPIAVDEIMDIKNTEEMIKEIKKRFPGRQIYVYPDSSGKSEKSNSSQTDINLLKAAGFNVEYNSKNPFVVDRINSMNAMLCNGDGFRRYRVNVSKCPKFTQSLEQQTYDNNGKPDKAHDQDHPNDAAGYFIWKKYPLVAHTKRATIQLR